MASGPGSGSAGRWKGGGEEGRRDRDTEVGTGRCPDQAVRSGDHQGGEDLGRVCSWSTGIDDKIFFEIPTEELGKEMLWVTQLEQTQAGHSYAGEPVGDRVVRWEQRGDDILLRDVKYEIRADVSDPISDAVKATSLEAIIAVFPIQAYGKDKRPVIDVTLGLDLRPARVQRQRAAPCQLGSTRGGRSSRR